MVLRDIVSSFPIPHFSPYLSTLIFLRESKGERETSMAVANIDWLPPIPAI